MSADTLLSRLDGVRSLGRDRWRAKCPVCGGANSSKLALRERDGGTVLVHCFGCDASGPQVCEALGVDAAELFPPRDAGFDERNRRPREQRPFSASDALACLSMEGTLLAVCAGDLAQGKTLDDPTRQRLLVAAGRINAAVGLCRG